MDIEECFKTYFKAAVSFKPAETTKAANILLVYVQHPQSIQVLSKYIKNSSFNYKNVYELTIFVLIEHLDEQIRLAEDNFKELKVYSTPFYGLILSIRQILKCLDAR